MEKELEVIINIGIPASGKSTFTKEFIKKNPNYVKISRDDFRYMLKDCGWCEPKIEKMITYMHNEAIVTALCNKLNVIVDNTNVKLSSINEIINLVKEYANVSFRVFDTPLKTCLERDAARERSVGKDVINKMYANYKILMDSFDFQPVKKDRIKKFVEPNYKSDLPDCCVFDIDGTLALNKNKRDYYDYEHVDRDDLNKIVAEQIKFHKLEGRTIIIMSGRDEVCRKITEDWLKFYEIEYDMLLMRPKDNVEKDTIIKKRLYDAEIKDKYNVLAIYDDRSSVCDMWFRQDLFVFSCNQGNKKF